MNLVLVSVLVLDPVSQDLISYCPPPTINRYFPAETIERTAE
jgi:hypothetical protein